MDKALFLWFSTVPLHCLPDRADDEGIQAFATDFGMTFNIGFKAFWQGQIDTVSVFGLPLVFVFRSIHNLSSFYMIWQKVVRKTVNFVNCKSRAQDI